LPGQFLHGQAFIVRALDAFPDFVGQRQKVPKLALYFFLAGRGLFILLIPVRVLRRWSSGTLDDPGIFDAGLLVLDA
jgi:hypothetical protein